MARIRSNYQKLQLALFCGSCLIILLYLVLFYAQVLGPGELLGTSPLNLAIAGLHVVYFILLRSWLNGHSTLSATVADLIFFSLNILILVLVTGGFQSAYFVFWIFIILISAALGAEVMYAYTGITASYFIVATLLSNDWLGYLHHHAAYLIASWIAGGLGLWLWRNHPAAESKDHQVNQLSEKLNVEQIKSEILLKSIGDGVVVISLDGEIQLFNGPACVITGWPQDEAIGVNYRSVLILEDEAGKQLTDEDDPFHKVMSSKSSVRRTNLMLLNRNQRKIHLSLVASPIFSGSSQVTGAIGVFHDISAEKAAARQRDEFISTASHEMRTPVAAIEGFLALAMNDKVAQVDDKARMYIEKAHASTQHLGKLFQDLLSVTKLEDGRLANHPEPFELGKLIKTAIDELNFKAEQKNIELKLKSSHETGNIKADNDVLPLFYINADPERIREVFINLVDNAIKFTPEGQVNISIGGDDRQITVGVHDQGIGIPKDEIPHLFQKFYRIDSSATREIGGTGLGLYLCRTIIELYNGHIWVESEEGKGSDFYFSLPRLTYAQAQEIKAKLEKARKGVPKPQEPGETVAPNTTNT
ncbi:MAG: ATP-binding protein [Candidatus Saccharimonadales bacterium]